MLVIFNVNLDVHQCHEVQKLISHSHFVLVSRSCLQYLAVDGRSGDACQGYVPSGTCMEKLLRNHGNGAGTSAVRFISSFLNNATHQVVSFLFLEIQFDHRTLALGTLGAVSAMYAAAVRSPHFKALPAASRRALHHVVSVFVRAFFCVGFSFSKREKVCCSSAHSNSANCIILFQAGMAVVQVGLGISTLLMFVPVHLAATHQVKQ